MNDFKVRYVKSGVATYVDFLTSQNKTFIVTDKDETIIVDAFKVEPANRLKFLEYVTKSAIKWVYTAAWSGNPSDMEVTENLYKFHILESIDSELIQDTSTISEVVLPDTTYVDTNGDTITIPGAVIPEVNIKTFKSYNDMYSAATAAGAFYSHLGLPEYYTGLANYNGQLFN